MRNRVYRPLLLQVECWGRCKTENKDMLPLIHARYAAKFNQSYFIISKLCLSEQTRNANSTADLQQEMQLMCREVRPSIRHSNDVCSHWCARDQRKRLHRCQLLGISASEAYYLSTWIVPGRKAERRKNTASQLVTRFWHKPLRPVRFIPLLLNVQF